MNARQILENAGLTWVENEVKIDNFALPYIKKVNGKYEVTDPLPTDILRPWEAGQELTPKVTLVHFMLHECDVCLDEIPYLHAYFMGKSLPGKLIRPKVPDHVAYFQMSYGTNATEVIAEEMMPLTPDGAKTHLDLEEGLAARLGVIGAPATWLMDEVGFVVGYRNGPMNFDTPGFEALMGWIDQRAAAGESGVAGKSLHAIVVKAIDVPPPGHVKVLDGIFLQVLAVGFAVAVCYALFRAFGKHRTWRRKR